MHSPSGAADRFRLLILGTSAAMALSVARAEPTLPDAWQQADSFLFNDATESFREAPASANQRERAFGEAVSLLNFQPQTAANTESALATFERLAKEDPNDTIGVLSRYFQGRVNQLHLRPPNGKKAAEIYEDLVKARTGNPLAENAAGVLVLLKTYGNPDESDPIAKLTALEELAPYLTSSAGLRGYHFNMAYSYLDFGGRENKDTLAKALSHLLATEQAGVTRWQDEANLFLTTAEVARLLGDNELAVTYYGKFSTKYKRDSRNYYARMEIEKLKAAAPSPTALPAETPLPTATPVPNP